MSTTLLRAPPPGFSDLATALSVLLSKFYLNLFQLLAQLDDYSAVLMSDDS